MSKAKMNEELATAEVVKWMDYKKISPKKREEQKEAIETIAEAIQYGYLVLKDDFKFVMNLKFPLTGEDGSTELETLEFKARLNNAALHPKMQKVKGLDLTGMMLAHVSALTGQNTGIVRLLDSEDTRVANAIAGFFM